MSGDIVERLRRLAKMYPLWRDVVERSNEAADEIERLRAEVVVLRDELRLAGEEARRER